MGSQHLIKELSEEIYFYRSHTFAEATKGTYHTYCKAYFQFCELMGFNPLPDTTVIICQYAAFLAQSLKLSLIRNYITIISLLHKEFSLPYPLQDNWAIRSLLQEIKHVKGGEISQKLPITLDILPRIRSRLNLQHSFDATFWAVCLVAFYGLFRKADLLPNSDQDYDPMKQFQFSDCGWHLWGILLQVRWSKTIQFRKRVVEIPLPCIPNSPIRPYQATRDVFEFTRAAPHSSHAFSWIDHRTLLIHCLTYHVFLTKLKSCLSSLGHDTSLYAGHSFRQGGASFAFQTGVPVELIKMLGDWKSDSVLLYLSVPLNIRLQAVNLPSKHILHTTSPT